MMQGINCKKCEELLSLRWDSESLNAGDEASLNAHLSQCVSCTRLASEMGALLSESQQMASLKYPREIQISPLILRPSRPNLVMPWVFAAGFGMIMLVMGFGLSSRMIASQEGEMHTQHVSQASAVAVSGPVGDMLVRFAVPIEAAHSVEVVGDFTNWEHKIPLQVNQAGMWTGELRLQPGRYRYVIVVDGEKMLPDPGARQVVDDGFGGKSSVLDLNSI